MFKNCFKIFVIALFNIVALQGYAGANDKNDIFLLNKEIDQLKAVEEAFQFNKQEFETVSQEENVSKAEKLEFARFVASLKVKVAQSCESVRALGGDGNEHNVDCSSLLADPQNQANGSVSDIQRQATQQERSTALANELRQLESDIDGMLLREQEKLAAERSSGGSAQGTFGQMGGDGQAGGGADTQAQSNDQEDVTGEGPANSAQTGAGAGSSMKNSGNIAASSGQPPGDSRDDDVVARQLREAAEAETDPQLKEQLWEEYRKYKENKR